MTDADSVVTTNNATFTTAGGGGGGGSAFTSSDTAAQALLLVAIISVPIILFIVVIFCSPSSSNRKIFQTNSVRPGTGSQRNGHRPNGSARSRESNNAQPKPTVAMVDMNERETIITTHCTL